MVDFPLTLTSSEFVAALQALLDSGWVDQRTRLVLFDHLIYNNEANAFVSVRVSFELQPWGFVRARVQARTMRLGYVRSLDIGLLVLDALVYANVIVSLVLTLKKLLHLRLDFFKVTRASFTRASFYSPSLLVDFSLSLSVSLSLARALSLPPSLPQSQLNILDLCNQSCFIVTLYLKIALNLFTGTLLATPPSPEDGYTDFDYGVDVLLMCCYGVDVLLMCC